MNGRGSWGGDHREFLVLRDLSVLPVPECCEIGDVVSHPGAGSVWCISLCFRTVGLDQ